MAGSRCVKHRKKSLCEVWCNFLAFNLDLTVFPIILASQLGVFPWSSHRFRKNDKTAVTRLCENLSLGSPQ